MHVDRHLNCLQIWAIINKAATNIHVKSLYRHVFLFFLSKYLSVEWLDLTAGVCLHFKTVSFPKLYYFTFPQTVYKLSSSPSSCQYLIWSIFSFYPFNRCVVEHTIFIVCISLMNNVVEHIFRCVVPFICLCG